MNFIVCNEIKSFHRTPETSLFHIYINKTFTFFIGVKIWQILLLDVKLFTSNA